MHLGKKEGFKGSKNEMSVKMVRFCKVCLRLECVYRTAFYGKSTAHHSLKDSRLPLHSNEQLSCNTQ